MMAISIHSRDKQAASEPAPVTFAFFHYLCYPVCIGMNLLAAPTERQGQLWRYDAIHRLIAESPFRRRDISVLCPVRAQSHTAE
jgi:hypothetical protein